MKAISYKICTAALAASLLLNLTACQKEPPKTIASVTAHATDLMKDITAKQVAGKDADTDFINAQTAFALSILQQTAKSSRDTDLLVSPYSIMQALAMAANGAKEDTLAEMAAVLGTDIDTLNEYLYTLRKNQPNDENCKLSTANSVWFRDDTDRIRVEQEFLQKNADYYDAAAYMAPFDNSTLEAINGWCKAKTDGMIPELISEIKPEAVMYLINAVAFDAKWSTEYLETDVRERDFTCFDGSTKQVQMMYSDEGTYYADGQATGFAKSYKGGKYAFAALLPNDGISVYDYVNSLTAESLAETLANPQYCKVSAGLPEFSYDYDNELSDELTEMGMKKAFTPGADFSRMAWTATGELYINRVIHKTHIEVDPHGTKAAALTAVEMTDGCESIEDPEEIKYVILDRPFVYMILDTETHLPVFIGIMGNPA